MDSALLLVENWPAGRPRFRPCRVLRAYHTLRMMVRQATEYSFWSRWLIASCSQSVVANCPLASAICLASARCVRVTENARLLVPGWETSTNSADFDCDDWSNLRYSMSVSIIIWRDVINFGPVLNVCLRNPPLKERVTKIDFVS